MSTPTQLFQFYNFGADPSNGGPRLNGAPRLAPAGGSGGFISKDSPGYSLIDVVNDFQWTTTPPKGRREVPAIYLKEKRLVTNALIAQAAYYSLALGGIAGGAVAGFANLPPVVQSTILTALGAFGGRAVGSLVGKLGDSLSPLIAAAATRNPIAGAGTNFAVDLVSRFLPAAGTTVGAGAGFLSSPDVPEQALGLFDQVLENVKNRIPQRFNLEGLGSETLKPYEGLYITEDTKFLYNLPYFSDNQNSIFNSFSDQDEAFTQLNLTGAGELTRSMREVAMGASAAINFEAPGVYIEKPKFFNFESYGETVSFTFPLINTGWSTFNDVLKNWQLLYLLIYQNRPNRRSRDLIDPPVIYEVTIPGIRYSPFAYIENMSVDFKGSRRRMDIPVPYNGGTTVINTIIPDAYIVTVRLRTLIGETQNFLYSMIHDKQNIVTVTDKFDPFDYLQKVIDSGYSNTAATQQIPVAEPGSKLLDNFRNATTNNPTNLGLPPKL